jgi:hypothetical protein
MTWKAYTDFGDPLTGIVLNTSSTASSRIITTTDTVYYSPSSYSQYSTGLGTEINLAFIKDKKVIHPRLYFKFVKSKMSKLHQKELNDRLSKLQKLLIQAEDLGQTSLYEDLARKIAITIKEQEINVCGIEFTVHEEAIKKYKEKVKGPEIGFCSLEKYARPIPSMVKKRIEKCKELKLFDNYWVLYLEYKEKTDIGNKKKEENTEKKTNKEKIKEKDPILFGTLDFLPDKFYFIVDWIDEYCDLTIDKFVEVVKKDSSEFDLDRIDNITPKLLQKLVQEVRDRHDRLKNTNSKNFEKLMEEENNFYTRKIKNLNNKYPKIKENKDKIIKKVEELNNKFNELMVKIYKKMK